MTDKNNDRGTVTESASPPDYQIQLKKLDGFFWPNRGYWETLQEKYIIACKYIRRLETENARAGNKWYQRDAAEYAKLYHAACRRASEAEAKASGLEIENGILKKALEELQRVLKPEHAAQLRLANGRFGSTDQMSKPEKCKAAYQMREAGFDDQQIAADLGIAYDSVRKYIRVYEKTLEEDTVWVHQTENPCTYKAVRRSDVVNGAWRQDNSWVVVNTD